jgi:hypothetical protein
LTFANEVEIRSDWREMTDTATIKIAKKILVRGLDLEEKNIIDVIKTGDRVEIRIGYDGNNITRFKGYVARSVMPTMPLMIQCEDEMWNLKRMPVQTRTFANHKLEDVIKYACPGYKYDLLNTSLGTNYVVRTGTAAGTLMDIEKTFGLKSFFRMVNGEPVLVVGKPYGSADLLTAAPVKYHFQKNVKENSLQYMRADDVRIKVRAICKVVKGKDLKVEVGDPDGGIRTVHYMNVSEATLRKNAEADLKKFKVDGYSGDIVGFGLPKGVLHGLIAELIDEQYELRGASDRYHIDAVTDNFGTNGYEVTATIGWRANATATNREK